MTRTISPPRMPAVLSNGQHIPTIAVILIWMANVVTIWSHRSRSRRDLQQLRPHQLDDLGISRAEAEQESLKRFWMP